MDNTKQISPFSLLHLVTCTPDFIPLWPQKKDFPKIQDAIYGHEKELLTESVDLEDEGRMKGALVLQEWTEETSINEFEKEWNVQPGDLRSRVDLAEWLLFRQEQFSWMTKNYPEWIQNHIVYYSRL